MRFLSPRISLGVQFMKDPFKEFIEEMARLTVPEDDTEEPARDRRVRVGDANQRTR
jgi:hypothetical protein